MVIKVNIFCRILFVVCMLFSNIFIMENDSIVSGLYDVVVLFRVAGLLESSKNVIEFTS